MPAPGPPRIPQAPALRWRAWLLLALLIPALLSELPWRGAAHSHPPPEVAQTLAVPAAPILAPPSISALPMQPPARHRAHRSRILPPAVSLAPVPTSVERVTVSAPAPTPPGLTDAAGDESDVWLDVTLNGTPMGTALWLRDGAGHLWARAEDLRAWRLRPPLAEPRRHNGEAYYELDAFAGLRYQLDEAAQSITIDAPPRLFTDTLLTASSHRLATPGPAALGGFVNYDAVVARSGGGGAPNHTAATGLFEAGVFGRAGTATSTFARTDGDTGAQLVRLDTTFTHDVPGRHASLRVGDSVSRAGSWGGAVRFGGVQWSTDFSTEPGFVSAPLSGVRGEAALPSTIDLYVNDALRLHTNVPAGPFSIADLPLVSGQGETRVVVRDVLGREQLISTPYFTSPTLLRPGLASYSYEAGLARNNYGIGSSDYGRAVLVGTHRLGLTNQLTGEVHGELLRDQQTLGAGGVWAVPGIGVLSAGAAASHAARGSGELVQFGLERQWSRYSFGGSARLTTAHYAQVGMLPTDVAPPSVIQAFLSAALPRRVSLSANYIEQDHRDHTSVHLLTLRSSAPVGVAGLAGYASLALLKPVRGGSGATVSLDFNVALGERRTASLAADRTRDDHQELLQLQQNLPAGEGVGYRVVAGVETTAPRDATLSYQTDTGTYALRAISVDHQFGTSVEAQGGIAVLDGETFLSRRLDQSFAVVHVGDYPNVRVYADNQEVAHTDARGRALVPRLRAYEQNTVRVEETDLPFEAEIDAFEQTAVPARRSGQRVDFGIRHVAGAVLTLLLEDGTPVPAGAVLHIAGSDEDYPVGLHGEAYLTGLAAASALEVRWAGRACTATLAYTASAEPVQRLAPLVCREGPT